SAHAATAPLTARSVAGGRVAGATACAAASAGAVAARRLPARGRRAGAARVAAGQRTAPVARGAFPWPVGTALRRPLATGLAEVLERFSLESFAGALRTRELAGRGARDLELLVQVVGVGVGLLRLRER